MSKREQAVVEFLCGLGGGLSAEVKEIKLTPGVRGPSARELIMIREGERRLGVLTLSEPSQNGDALPWRLGHYRPEDRERCRELGRALARRFRMKIQIWFLAELDEASGRLITGSAASEPEAGQGEAFFSQCAFSRGPELR